MCLFALPETKFWTVNAAQPIQPCMEHKVAFLVQKFYWSEFGQVVLLTVLLKKIVKTK